MGQYNPRSPYIIGQEWVPIRQADYLPDDRITERGYTWNLGNSTTIVSGAYYTTAPPDAAAANMAEFMAVYPAGLENQTGPIKSVIIPVSSAVGTGAAISASTASLLNPSDGTATQFQGGQGVASANLGISFDVASYSQQLFGKRILDVRLRYMADGPPAALATIQVFMSRLAALGSDELLLSQGLEGVASQAAGPSIETISLSDLNIFWQSGVTKNNQRFLYPWRYQELANFVTTAPFADRLIIYMVASLGSLTTADDVNLHYAALEVVYCEEQRVLYGGDNVNSVSPIPAGPGGKMVALRTPAMALPSASAAGEYTVVHNQCQYGWNGGVAFLPQMTALRELYQLPNQRAVDITRSLVLDDTLTTSDRDTLPHLTLHHTGGVVTGVHAYGTQNDIPVYGTITAVQEIEDDPAGTSKQYPQVRFYARRFGDTTVPLRLIDVATGTFTVSISVPAFDALPEIVDGWKEVTLRFATPPSFATAAGDVDWRWDAVGETAGNQWQVLGCDGPSVTQSIGPATYYAPSGSTVALTWQSPAISGLAEDPLSDAVLIFSTDPPAVTGFTLGTCSQAVTGTTECNLPSSCIPTGIWGNSLTWNVAAVFDTFTRTVVDGWGTSDSGGTWTLAGGTNPGNYDVNGTQGTHTLDSTNVTRHSVIPNLVPSGDFDITAKATMPVIPATAAASARVVARYTDVINLYSARLTFNTNATVTIDIVEIVAGVGAVLSTTITLTALHAAGDQWGIRFRGVESQLMVKAWNITKGQTEPIMWQTTVADTSLTSGSVGVASRRETGESSGTFDVSFDDFCATHPALSDGGYLEIERSDSLTGWQQIARLEDTCAVTGICDFEARVGVESSYRARTCNSLDFCGSWVTGTATIPIPGVQGTSGNSVLIFTSNQDTAASLAYPMQFDGTPIEQFTFPEADTVQLQRMFGKDFFTAFHPLERGGDRFQRTLLVSAAAIPLESLANFEDLRDLAWAELPYVCVRDELGNRWYATVIVPSGNVRRNRTIYFAQIDVVETTDTPAPIEH